MAILEYASNLSQLFDLFLVLIALATAGYAVKVKFINAAIRAAKEVDVKVKVEHDRNNTQDLRLNSNENDIAYLKGVEHRSHE